MKTWMIALLIWSAGCAHKNLNPPTGGGLFPYGNYQHQAKVKITQPPRTMEMRGVIAHTEDKIKVVGLSSFGTTLFRIEEDLKTGKISKEFFLEAIQRHEDKFMSFYGMIHDLILAPKGSTDFTKQGAHFVVTEPDERGIYRKIHAEHSQFVVDIEVTGYDF
jgi:hypothetical protein